MFTVTRKTVKSGRVLAAAALIAMSAPPAALAEDRVSTQEVQALVGELQENAEECRAEILPYANALQARLDDVNKALAYFSDPNRIVTPFGGTTQIIGGMALRVWTVAEFKETLRFLQSIGIINEQGAKALSARALELTSGAKLRLRNQARELEKEQSSLRDYCRETESMLAQAQAVLTALRQSGTGSGAPKPPGRSPEIIVNSASVTEPGLTCDIGATTASCVKVSGGDRCSYRAWWEFPSMGELVPGDTFDLKLRGSYACNYDAGPAPKRGPNWGTNVGYDYKGGLLGFGWSKPGHGGLAGWTGATGCIMYFGAHGSGSTEKDVTKTCTFWVPETFPNARLGKADPNEPDYRIQAFFSPTWWAAKWVIR